MRLTLFAIFALGTAAFAQTHSPTGSYGNVLHPGVPSPRSLRAFAPSRLGSIHGWVLHLRPPLLRRQHRLRRLSNVWVRNRIGLNFDNFYSDGYAPPSAPEPPAPPDAPTPTVIINEISETDPVRPILRDYSNVPLPEPGTVLVPPNSAPQQANDQPTIFLIAMKDDTIVPVIAYWVDGATLHYVSVEKRPHRSEPGTKSTAISRGNQRRPPRPLRPSPPLVDDTRLRHDRLHSRPVIASPQPGLGARHHRTLPLHLGTIGASLQTIVGGNITLLTDLCEKTREQAFEKMVSDAIMMGADAVIGMRYDATEVMQGVTEVLCYGTAVRVEKITS